MNSSNLKVNGVFLSLGGFILSTLPEINKLRNIAKLFNAAVKGISESKLDDSVLSPEIHIDDYNTHHCGWNRHGVREVC